MSSGSRRHGGARPVRPYQPGAPVNPIPFDPRQSTFIPDLSVTNTKISEVSTLKVEGIGIKVYASGTNTIVNNTPETLAFNTVAFNRAFQDPGASFTAVTIPYTGVYTLTGLIEFESNATNSRTVGFEIDASGVIVAGARLPSSGVWRLSYNDDRFLEAGQTVGIRVTQNSGSNLALSAGEDNQALSVLFRFTV